MKECKKMTVAFKFQQWLREHGPATTAEIKAAGFDVFGAPINRMLKFGAIEKYEGPNPRSERRYARIVTSLYMATEKDYTDQRGQQPRSRAPAKTREETIVARAVSILQKRGWTVTPPGALEGGAA